MRRLFPRSRAQWLVASLVFCLTLFVGIRALRAANVTYLLFDAQSRSSYPLRLQDNLDGTYSVAVAPPSGMSMRQTAGGPALGQAVFQYTGKIALSSSATTTTNIKTVTAGKTFYITDLYISYDTSAQEDTRIQAAGLDIFRCVVKGDTAPLQMAGLETQPQATAGQAVTILWPQITGTVNGYYYLAGYEQ